MKARLSILIALFISLFALPLGCESTAPGPEATPTQDVTFAPDAELLTVSYIDVGQGDCILIQTPGGKTMLIDAGDTFAKDAILGYLGQKGIQRIDFLMITHPKQSHIGSMVPVLERIPVDCILMPQCTASNNRETYENLLKTIDARKVPVVYAKAGMDIELDTALTAHVLAPKGTDYADLNAYSIVIKIVYGKTSFLFTGDASDISEKEMLGSGADLTADVLKIGHHGDAASTTAAFLGAVSPKIAVISVGRDNSYGYPTQDVLDRLGAKGVAVYRTDLDGTTVISSDGRTYRIECLGAK